MAVLHGSWISTDTFFVWGETWRRCALVSPDKVAPDHPYALSVDEIASTLKQHGLNSVLASMTTQAKTAKLSVALPSHEQTLESGTWAILPIYSLGDLDDLDDLKDVSNIAAAPQDQPELQAFAVYPWQVEGWVLDPPTMIAFVRSLPVSLAQPVDDIWIGDDLRFWSHIERWGLDLLARTKILPTLTTDATGVVQARWQPLLDSALDQERFRKFVKQMPLICCHYQSQIQLVLDVPSAPPALLVQSLQTLLDIQVRQVVQSLPCPPLNPKERTRSSKDHPLQQWLKSLGTATGVWQASPSLQHQLSQCLETWRAPLPSIVPEANQYRVCFILHPPAETADQRSSGVNAQDWSLEYALQAADDANFLVRATTLWNSPVERLVYQGREILSPQEVLLTGLGLASRLYPLLERSLQNQRPQSCWLTPLQAYEFIKSVIWRLQDSGFGVILPESLAQLKAENSRLGLKITAETPAQRPNQRLSLQSLLTFQWELSIGGQTLSRAEFERLAHLNTPLVSINGAWVELRPQDIQAAQTFFANRKQQLSLSLEDALRMSMGDTQTIEKLPVVGFEASGALQNLITTLTGKRSPEPIPVSQHFRGELRPYQARGAGWLAFLEQWGLGACLADDMGLGKTIQTIAFLLHLQGQNALDRPVLLVCPTSVLGNWEREIHKFSPTLKTRVHHGEKRLRGLALAKAIQTVQVVITSYALVHRDAADLQKLQWQGLILDEAQNVKNPETKQAQTVRQIPAHFRIALTGTPVENRLAELWAILDFLNPGYLGNRNFFQRRFATPIERYGDTASLQALRSLVQPFILRRLKTDKDIIQDLPEKQEVPVFCRLSTEQAQLYQYTVERSLQDIDESEGIQRRGMILALLVKLKQICNHPAQYLGEKELGLNGRSGKLQRFEELLEEVLAEGDRALVFTQFAEWGKLLKTHLEDQLGREVLFLYGGTSKKQREELIDRFQHDPQGPRLFILSLKAGGVGLNLTRANHVFHFDRWWNPAVENQATDRVFRIGQTKNVLVHKFVCSGTLEEKIHDLIESKKALAEQVVGAGENWLTDLDTDQLRSLLLLDRNAIIEDD